MSEPRRFGGLSTETKPTDFSVKPGDEFYEYDTLDIFTYDGNSWNQSGTGGAADVYETKATGFKPSAYDTDLTMDGTAQSVALATGVSLGAGRIRVTNRGATTEAIRVAFGTSAANAEANLTISAAAATTGVYIGAAADFHNPVAVLGVPALATHYAVANAVASDTQVVSIEQGL